MNGNLLNAISNISNSDQQEYEEITNKFVEIGESYPVTADEITAAIKREEREMTCTHDCSRCPHGTTEALKGICIGPNTTCNGNCSNCQFYIVLKYIVNCGLRG